MEAPLTAATDKTLNQSFTHTSEAGPKIASAQQVQQIAAGRQLLNKLAGMVNPAPARA